jgi:hypothetical protein
MARKGTPSTTTGFATATPAEHMIATPAKNMTPSTKGAFINPSGRFLDAANAGNVGGDPNAAENDQNT